MSSRFVGDSYGSAREVTGPGLIPAEVGGQGIGEVDVNQGGQFQVSDPKNSSGRLIQVCLRRVTRIVLRAGGCQNT